MLKITAEKREVFGKDLKSARAAGKMPVVVYGGKETTTPFFVDAKNFKKALAKAGESTVVSIETDKGTKDALIHEVDFHPVSGEPRHADFLVIDRTKAIKIHVPLRFDGVSGAVKDLGGTLVKVLHEIEIETLPLNIPHDVVVDISLLTALDSQILIKDLSVAKDIKVLHQPEEVVASIAVAKDEPVEEVPVDLSSIEVEKKGKKEEEGDAESTPAPDAK